jgi:hypothetical protein
VRHSGDHFIFMLDLQFTKQLVERLVAHLQRIAIADCNSHGGLAANRVRVRADKRGRVARRHEGFVAAEGVPEYRRLLRGHDIGPNQGACHDAHDPEHLRILEAEMRGSVASHGEAFDGACFALGESAISPIDVRYQLVDDHTLDGRFTIGRITVEPVPHSIHQHDNHGGGLSVADGTLQLRHEPGAGTLVSTHAVQPVCDREAPIGGRLILGRQVDQVTDLASGQTAGECAVACPGGLTAVRIEPSRRRTGGLRHRGQRGQ